MNHFCNVLETKELSNNALNFWVPAKRDLARINELTRPRLMRTDNELNSLSYYDKVSYTVLS